jgi:hypothetical protein
MVNHPNRNRALKTEVNGVRFKLSFDAAGYPCVLNQWQQDDAGRWHWAIAWAAWHKDKLTGAKAIALHQLVRTGSPPPFPRSAAEQPARGAYG